jgi:hypothetical protein
MRVTLRNTSVYCCCLQAVTSFQHIVTSSGTFVAPLGMVIIKLQLHQQSPHFVVVLDQCNRFTEPLLTVFVKMQPH